MDMNRDEFLNILDMQLQGGIPSPEIPRHIAYYNDFIDQQLRQGQTESDILEELGDPRLIAKTLIDTEDVPNVHGYRQNYDYSAEESCPEDAAQEDAQQKGPRRGILHWLDPATWYGRAALAAFALLIIIVLFLALRALLPIALILLAIGMIISLFDRRR